MYIGVLAGIVEFWMISKGNPFESSVKPENIGF